MGKTLFKRTKILATVGAIADNGREEILREMVGAGVNGFRMNFSHGKNEEREEQIRWIRDAADKRGKSVSVVQDLQGPKIRLGEVADNRYEVKKHDRIILEFGIEKQEGNRIPVQYNLADKVKVGEEVYIFDGKVRTVATAITSDTSIEVEVQNDGILMSKKGINLPHTDMGGDILTEKDLADMEYGAGQDYDYLAVSFIQSLADIEIIKAKMAEYGHKAKLIAKIETRKAVENNETLEAIVKASDGIMIARGDMAVEAGAEVVPIVQRRLIALCRVYSKICIVATQMMMSMTENPEPTRAEVSDVASAVMLGADVVMLSDETTNGKYPIEAVRAMKKVILYTQNHSRVLPIKHESTKDFHSHNYNAIARAAVGLAEEMEVDVIIAQTKTGATAMAVATERPNLPILSVTSNPQVARQLALTFANSAFVRPYSDNYGIHLAQELTNNGYLQKPEGGRRLRVVIVSGITDMTWGTDTIQVREI